VEASVNELPVKVIQSVRQPVMCEKSVVATARGGWGEGGRGTVGKGGTNRFEVGAFCIEINLASFQLCATNIHASVVSWLQTGEQVQLNLVGCTELQKLAKLENL